MVSGGTKLELVTPEQAQEWLDNRSVYMTHPVIPEKVAHFVEVIRAGEWEPSTIRIRNGNLRNGQHRLSAIVQTNQAVEIRVTRHTVT